MIFSIDGHIDLIKRGKKTQTRRPSDRYQVGKAYSIQPGRGIKGIPEGKILIIDKKGESAHRRGISMRDAKAEGDYSPNSFEDLYEKMYPHWKTRWAYHFKFKQSKRREIDE